MSEPDGTYTVRRCAKCDAVVTDWGRSDIYCTGCGLHPLACTCSEEEPTDE